MVMEASGHTLPRPHFIPGLSRHPRISSLVSWMLVGGAWASIFFNQCRCNRHGIALNLAVLMIVSGFLDYGYDWVFLEPFSSVFCQFSIFLMVGRWQLPSQASLLVLFWGSRMELPKAFQGLSKLVLCRACLLLRRTGVEFFIWLVLFFAIFN